MDDYAFGCTEVVCERIVLLTVVHYVQDENNLLAWVVVLDAEQMGWSCRRIARLVVPGANGETSSATGFESVAHFGRD